MISTRHRHQPSRAFRGWMNLNQTPQMTAHYIIEINGSPYCGESTQTIEQKPHLGSGTRPQFRRALIAGVPGRDEPLPILGRTNLRSHMDRIMSVVGDGDAVGQMRGGRISMERIQTILVREVIEAPASEIHNHACGCGTADQPHNTGDHGCVRLMIAAPTPAPDHPIYGKMWFVDDGDPITDFTLRQQRGYWQHPCGCWSRHPGSSNSIEA